MERFFGGNPVLVVLRLLILSVVVGVLLSALGLSPYDIIASMRRLFTHIYNLGFDAVEWGARYFLLGACIVFPIWLIARLIRMAGGGGRPHAERAERPQRAERSLRDL